MKNDPKNAAAQAAAIETIKTARTLAGRNYKLAIQRAWFNGDYSAVGLESIASELQIIRNTLGPTWLFNLRLPHNNAFANSVS